MFKFKRIPAVLAVTLIAAGLVVSSMGSVAQGATPPTPQKSAPAAVKKIAKRYAKLSQKQRRHLKSGGGGLTRMQPRNAVGGWQSEGCNPTVYYYGWNFTECQYVINYSGGWTRVYTYTWVNNYHAYINDPYGVLGLGAGWITLI
jgi:hypothetical protein